MMDSMQTVLIVIHLLVVLALIGVVLIQRSEGGGLGIGGGGGGGGGFFTARGSANVLTRATAILAVLFFITSLALTIQAGWGRSPRSILQLRRGRGRGRSGPQVPQSGGSILDQIRPQGGGADQGATPRRRPRLRARRFRSPSKPRVSAVAVGSRGDTVLSPTGEARPTPASPSPNRVCTR